MVGSFDMVGQFEPVGSFDMAGSFEPVGSFSLVRSFEPVGSFDIVGPAVYPKADSEIHCAHLENP